MTEYGRVWATEKRVMRIMGHGGRRGHPERLPGGVLNLRRYMTVGYRQTKKLFRGYGSLTVITWPDPSRHPKIRGIQEKRYNKVIFAPDTGSVTFFHECDPNPG
jgi:hypothetical protein